jgi:hypothetical protein
VLELLASNGERDEQQAVRAIAVLGEVLESQTREDFEQALAALARIHLAFPQAPLPAGLLIGATG